MLVGNDRITRVNEGQKEKEEKWDKLVMVKFVKIQMSEIAKALTKTHDKPFLMIFGGKCHGTRKRCRLYCISCKKKQKKREKLKSLESNLEEILLVSKKLNCPMETVFLFVKAT